MEKTEKKLKTTLQDNNIDLNNIEISNGDFNFGDIIYGKRYTNNQEKRKLPLDHRTGYFLVLNQNEKEIHCLYGTSDVPDNSSKYSYFRIDALEYDLEKDIYFSFFQSCLMKEHLVLSKEGKLNEQDYLRIVDKMKRCVNKEDSINCGDVVKNNDKKYLVLSSMEDKYGVLPMSSQGNTNIFFDNKDYYTSLQNFREISKNEVLIKLGAVNAQTLQTLKSLLEKYAEEVQFHKSMHVGSVVQNGNFYYIYEELENAYQAFKLASKDSKNKKRDIVINGKKFKALFEETITIPKSSKDFKPKYGASEKEEIYIDSLMKAFTAVPAYNDVNDLCDGDEEEKVKYGSLGFIVTNLADNKDYVIIARDQDICLLLDLEKYLEGKLYVVEAPSKGIKKRGVLGKKTFLEILNSMKDTYSSYMTRSYIPNLIKMYQG